MNYNEFVGYVGSCTGAFMVFFTAVEELGLLSLLIGVAIFVLSNVILTIGRGDIDELLSKE